MRMQASERAGRLRSVLTLLALAALAAPAAHSAAGAEPPGRIERITFKTEAAASKVIIMLSRPLPFHVSVLGGEEARRSARRLVLDFEETVIAPEAAGPVRVDDGLVQQIRTGQPAPGKARIVVDLAKNAPHSVAAYETPPHVTVTLDDAPETSDAAPPPPSPAPGT
ncbi:MAG: AMIN domain-containing protein [Myxococcales bacterium]|jgi:hypothetical protein|nr:AMIN domain-containing protein [Myxococcales bacterium]